MSHILFVILASVFVTVLIVAVPILAGKFIGGAMDMLDENGDHKEE